MTATSLFPLRAESELLLLCARTGIDERLKARIRNKAQQPLDWHQLFESAQRHGVGPLVFRALGDACPDLVPAAVLTQWRQRTQASTLLNRLLAKELGELCEAFAAGKVSVMPIKGATLAAMGYRDLTLRDFSDMDLLIHEASLAESERVLNAAGYRRKGERDADDHDDGPYHVFLKPRTLFRVDVQWVMAHEHFAFRLDRPDFWERSVSVALDDKTVQSLSPEDLLILLCVHGSKHVWEQLKWVCDVAELLRTQSGMNWRVVMSAAGRWRCRRLVLMGLWLAHHLLEAPLPEDMVIRCQLDRDVQMFARRMPSQLLADPAAGIGEEQAVAFYFSLKDSWWERWRFGMALCRSGNRVVTEPPGWFRWRRSLTSLGRVTSPVQRLVRKLLPTSVRGIINRWVEQGV